MNTRAYTGNVLPNRIRRGYHRVLRSAAAPPPAHLLAPHASRCLVCTTFTELKKIMQLPGARPPACLAIVMLIVGLGAIASASRGDEPNTSNDTVDYTETIRPLLDERCIDCHGPDEQEGGLRLDSFVGIRTGGNLGDTLVPGKSDESLMWRAISGGEGVEAMPSDDDTLEDDEIELIRRWIDQGAPAPADEVVADATNANSDHWAFQPIVRPALPDVAANDWPTNDIDRFILARFEQEGIVPSPPADRATVMRRVYLDLIGLPPSPAEVEAYLCPTRGAMRTSNWLTDCWRRRIMANAGGATGSTWRATPTRTVSRSTGHARSGNTVTRVIAALERRHAVRSICHRAIGR